MCSPLCVCEFKKPNLQEMGQPGNSQEHWYRSTVLPFSQSTGVTTELSQVAPFSSPS